MATDDEIQNALLAIHSRLGTIEGRVTLVARIDRDRILEDLEALVSKRPMVAQIYLLLDGRRTQRDVLAELGSHGIKTSEATVSRRLGEMHTEHGLVEPVSTGKAKVYRKSREMEDVLNLSKNMARWLDGSATVPIKPKKRAAKKKTDS